MLELRSIVEPLRLKPCVSSGKLRVSANHGMRLLPEKLCSSPAEKSKPSCRNHHKHANPVSTSSEFASTLKFELIIGSVPLQGVIFWRNFP